jgi:hypothetical protein
MMEEPRGCQNMAAAELLPTNRRLDEAYSVQLSQLCFRTTALSNNYFSLIYQQFLILFSVE